MYARSDGKDCAISQKVEEYWPWGRSREQFVKNLRIITAGAIALREHKCIISSSTTTPTRFLPVVDVLSESIQNESPIPSVAPSSTPSLSPIPSEFLDPIELDASLEPSFMVIPSNPPSPSPTNTDLQLNMAFRQDASLSGQVTVESPLEPSIPVIPTESLEPTSDPSLEPVSEIEPSSTPRIQTPELDVQVQVLNRGAVTVPYDTEDRIHKEPPPMAYQNAEKNPELKRHLPPGYKRGSKEDIEYFDGEPEDEYYDYDGKGDDDDDNDDDDEEEDEDAAVAQDMVEGANDFLEEAHNACDSGNHPINHVIGYLISIGFDFYFDSVSYDKAILDLI